MTLRQFSREISVLEAQEPGVVVCQFILNVQSTAEVCHRWIGTTNKTDVSEAIFPDDT